jgi:hypothetical protein
MNLGSVAFRPTVTGGLALSLKMIQNFFFTLITAISMPKTINSRKRLIFNGSQKIWNFTAIKIPTFF